MKSNHIHDTERLSIRRCGLLVRGMLLTGLLAVAPLHAVTFTQTLPMPGFTTGTTLLTENNPTLGTFNFSSTPYGSFSNLTSISLTLALYDLQTMATGTGQQRRDFNNISLTLGGVATGIRLNGYGRSVGSTVTTTGAPTNSAAILQALATNGGFLTFGLADATASPTNPFDYFGGVASLSLNVTVTAVPFNSSSTLGLAVVAAAALFRSWPRLKRRLATLRH